MSSKPDPREAYLALNVSRHINELPKAALEDLRFFAKRAKDGRTITFEALQKWLHEKRGFYIGRIRLATLARQHGVETWWKS